MLKILQPTSKSWTCITTISGYHKRPIYDLAWNKNNSLIATASGDNTIRIFKEILSNSDEKNIFEQIFSIKVSPTDVNCISWCPGSSIPNQLLASMSDDGALRIWEWKDDDDA